MAWNTACVEQLRWRRRFQLHSGLAARIVFGSSCTDSRSSATHTCPSWMVYCSFMLRAASAARARLPACLGKIDDRELVRSRELVADLLPPDLRGVATVAQCYPCPLSQCSARVPSCATINREFCKAQRADCGDDTRGSPYRC